MVNKKETAKQIISAMGGISNINSFTHCATRLRFDLKDASIVDTNEVQSIKGVMGGVPQGEHSYQVVIGGAVASMYEEVNEQFKKGSSSNSSQKTSSNLSNDEVKEKERSKVKGKNLRVDAFFEFLSDSFRPIIGVLLGASLILALLNLLISFGVIKTVSDYPVTLFLNGIAQAVFMFLPVLICYNACKKLKIDPWIGAVAMLALFTPQFLALGDPDSYKNLFTDSTTGQVLSGFQELKSSIKTIDIELLNKTYVVAHLFGFIPVIVCDYTCNVFVPLLTAGVLFWIDKALKKTIPDAVQLVFVPFLDLILIVPIAAIIIGPIGVFAGTGLGMIFNWMNEYVPFLFAIAIPLAYPFLVPLGLHWPLNALMLVNIKNGYDFIQAPMGCWNFACFGATAGVLFWAIRERDKDMREISGGALAAGLLGGISEPSLYGIHLRYKSVYPRLLAGCAAGGLTLAILTFFFPSTVVLQDGTTEVVQAVTTQAFAFTSILTIPLFNQMWVYAISIAVAFVTSFTMIVKFDYRTDEQKALMRSRIVSEKLGIMETEDFITASPEKIDAAMHALTDDENSSQRIKKSLISPIKGHTIALKDIGDDLFATGTTGKGLAVIPSDELVKKGSYVEICSPCHGKLMFIHENAHTFGLSSPSGVSVLVHIGLGTVNLNGEGFRSLVKEGDEINKGQPVVQVDLGLLKEKGCQLPVIVTVPNFYNLSSLEPVSAGSNVNVEDDIITLELAKNKESRRTLKSFVRQ